MDQNLVEFANGHHYFGFHKTPEGWYYREWAPGADNMYLTGDFCNWERYAHPMEKNKNGEFTLFLPGEDALSHGQRVMAVVVRQGQELDRIPLYARYVTESGGQWNAVIWDPPTSFRWTDGRFAPKRPLFIYECHIGMAQQEGKVGSYGEFTENILPRVKKAGYNAIQLMAIQEHPYYASFGYQVTNFFAPSSRFGTPDDLKQLINTAHKMGIAVLLDIVHAHAAPNTREGIAAFDGTDDQFFKPGLHPAWGTKCFDYGKEAVRHFLLSNLKYWKEAFHFDGFRFDGVTSMLYKDHGLTGSYGDTDPDAIHYLKQATALAKQLDPNTVLIAEEVSALEGLCRPDGLGFDYRLAMGEPDLWINLLKIPDEHWDLNHIYYELTCRRPGEPVIGYCESHDQALVGDKTLMFRLCDSQMYTHMDQASDDPVIHRGMALHKIIRLLTATLGGEGYLCFMGNEFGHPEWIDFPRAGNGDSFHYCRRRWDLVDNGALRYGQLGLFDRDLIMLCKRRRLLTAGDRQLWLDNEKKVLIYQKGKVLFAVNLHPVNSYDGVRIPVPKGGSYKIIMSTDDAQYGGFDRIPHRTYKATDAFQMYLPSRTAAVIGIEN